MNQLNYDPVMRDLDRYLAKEDRAHALDVAVEEQVLVILQEEDDYATTMRSGELVQVPGRFTIARDELIERMNISPDMRETVRFCAFIDTPSDEDLQRIGREFFDLYRKTVDCSEFRAYIEDLAATMVKERDEEHKLDAALSARGLD